MTGTDERDPIDEYRGEVPPTTTWPAWGPPAGDEWRCAVVLESTPEPATDPYEMEAE